MSEPDAVPLPREGEVFFDVRGESRTMRLSWYADSSVAVFSIWQGNRCTGTFRLPFGDLARMVETLQDGPPSRGLDQDPRHPGQPAYANAGPDPGYGYSEPAGYGPQATYAQGPGYGSGPDYETGVAYGEGPGYGYQDRFRAGAGPGDQYYGDYDRPAANAAYGPADRYGAPDYDAGVAPRYVPDVAGQAGYDQQAQDPPHAAPGYAAGSPGYAAGSPVSPGYASAAGYAGPPGYARSRDESADHRHQGGYRGETQFLAAPQGPAGPYYEDAQTAAWHEDQPDPEEQGPSDFPGRRANTGQVTRDWGPATASYRGR